MGDYVTYYDFVCNMLGRLPATIKLHIYDLHASEKLDDSVNWFPSMVTSKPVRHWHTSVVVNNKEYWYAGRISEFTPGKTPLGAPDRIIELPARTMRCRGDIWDFIAREMRFTFTPDVYHYKRRNGNHFSDALVLFLTNQHIPESLLASPDCTSLLVTNPTLRSWAMPYISIVFDRDVEVLTKSYTGSGDWRMAMHPDQDEWSKIAVQSLAEYEYEPGWRCVAQIVSKNEVAETCDVRWCDFRAARMRLEEDVPKACLRPLAGPATVKALTSG